MVMGACVVTEEHHVVFHVSGTCASGFAPKEGEREGGREGGRGGREGGKGVRGGRVMQRSVISLCGEWGVLHIGNECRKVACFLGNSTVNKQHSCLAPR